MHRARTRPTWRAAVAATVIAATACVATAAPPATAAAPPPSFYDPPATIPAGAHGTLVKSAATTVSFPGSPGVNEWSIMYKS